MPALFTPLRRRRLERVVQLEATSIPQPRPRFPWRLLAGGIAVGVGLAQLQRLTVRLAPPPPAAAGRCRELNFRLANLPASALEPVMTAEQMAEIRRHLGPQRPRPAAPAAAEADAGPGC